MATQPFNSEVEKCSSPSMDESSRVCGICLEEIKKQKVGKLTSPCRHVFCASCILEWWKDGKTTCPMDRLEFLAVFVFKDIESMNKKLCDIGIYQPGCKICDLIVDLRRCIYCRNCHLQYHQSCLGVEDRKEYRQLCPDCLKNPIHRTSCRCFLCRPVKQGSR